MLESPESFTSGSQYQMGLRRENTVTAVSFAYPIKTWSMALLCMGPPASLHMLEPVQNQALRTCFGAFWTSAVTSLHVEANEMPLVLRHMVSSEYCLRVSSNVQLHSHLSVHSIL